MLGSSKAVNTASALRDVKLSWMTPSSKKLFEEEPVRTRVIRGSRTDGATMNGVEKGLWAESTRAMRDGGGARVSCSLGMRDRAVEDI
jgi:hypothetical protein